MFGHFQKVVTVEINYSDPVDAPFVTEENRRRSQLCMLLRASTLVDIDCWSRVPGEPLRPADILGAMRQRLELGVTV